MAIKVNATVAGLMIGASLLCCGGPFMWLQLEPGQQVSVISWLIGFWFCIGGPLAGGALGYALALWRGGQLHIGRGRIEDL